MMNTISLADAKARLSELVARVEKGEDLCITRRGKPVVKLTRIEHPKEPIDVEALRALVASMPLSPLPAGEFIRRMRDEARY
jgi:prevent-host-death family protein